MPERIGPLNYVAFFILGIAFTSALACAVSIVGTHMIVAPNPADVVRHFNLLVGDVHPEPIENLVFVVTVIGGLLSMTIAAILARKGMKSCWALSVAIFGGALILIWALMIDPYSIIGPDGGRFGELLKYSGTFLIFSSATFLLLLVHRTRTGVALGVTSLCLIWLCSLNISGPADPFLEFVHQEVILYPIVQAWLGRGVLIDQQSQYGAFPMFLQPVWAVFGLSVRSYFFTMTSLVVFSFGSLVCFLWLVSRNKLVSNAVAFAGIVVCLLGYSFWPNEQYFQFYPIRSVFPCIALLLAAARLGRKFLVPAYAFLSLGIFWNLESGIAGLAGFAAFRIVWERADERTFIRIILTQLSACVIGFIIAFSSVAAYYLFAFGKLPNISQALDWLAIYGAGFASIPMPIHGAWVFHAFVYLAAAYLSVLAILKPLPLDRQVERAAIAALMTIGIIFMRYYQGRSHAVQLLLVTPFAFATAGLVISSLSSRSKVVTAVAVFIVSLGVGSVAGYWKSGPVRFRSWGAIYADAPSELERKVSAIVELWHREKRLPTDRIFVASGYAYLVNLAEGIAGPATSSGLCLIVREQDLDSVVLALQDTRTKLVVREGSAFCGDPLAHDRAEEELKRSYREVAFKQIPGPRFFVRLLD